MAEGRGSAKVNFFSPAQTIKIQNVTPFSTPVRMRFELIIELSRSFAILFLFLFFF